MPNVLVTRRAGDATPVVMRVIGEPEAGMASPPTSLLPPRRVDNPACGRPPFPPITSGSQRWFSSPNNDVGESPAEARRVLQV
jgi:hypothetical protein